MDDLKTYAKNNQEQTGLLDKCAKATFKKGKLTTNENIQIDLDTPPHYPRSRT